MFVIFKIATFIKHLVIKWEQLHHVTWYCREANRQVCRLWCYSITYQRWNQRRRESCSLSSAVHLPSWEYFPLSMWTGWRTGQITSRQGRKFINTYSEFILKARSANIFAWDRQYTKEKMLKKLVARPQKLTPILQNRSFMMSFVNPAFSRHNQLTMLCLQAVEICIL